jgi:hypothetical protein
MLSWWQVFSLTSPSAQASTRAIHRCAIFSMVRRAMRWPRVSSSSASPCAPPRGEGSDGHEAGADLLEDYTPLRLVPLWQPQQQRQGVEDAGEGLGPSSHGRPSLLRGAGWLCWLWLWYTALGVTSYQVCAFRPEGQEMPAPALRSSGFPSV